MRIINFRNIINTSLWGVEALFHCISSWLSDILKTKLFNQVTVAVISHIFSTYSPFSPIKYSIGEFFTHMSLQQWPPPPGSPLLSSHSVSPSLFLLSPQPLSSRLCTFPSLSSQGLIDNSRVTSGAESFPHVLPLLRSQQPWTSLSTSAGMHSHGGLIMHLSTE